MPVRLNGLQNIVVYMFAGIKLSQPFLCLASLFLLSCGSDVDVKEMVVVPDNVSEDFRHIVSSVQLIPLEESGEHLLGHTVDVQKCNDSFIVVDARNSKICRFSSDGHFLNIIGNRGNGPEEYLDITNIQILDGLVVVFSYPYKILYYSPDGSFVKSDTVKRLGLNSFLIGDGLLSYYGYGGEDNYRLYYKGMNSSEFDNRFLHFDKSVIDLGIGNNCFSERGDGSVSVLDSYSNVINVYDGGELSPYLVFDFGKYAINQKFFETNDPFVGAERYIINGNYAIINKFVSSDSIELVQIDRKGSKDDRIHTIYGIKSSSWKWYSFLEDKGDDDPCNPFRFIEGKTIYGVVDPNYLPAFIDSYKSIANNWDLVNDRLSDDAHIIVKFNLK